MTAASLMAVAVQLDDPELDGEEVSRRFLLPLPATLHDLHAAIQGVMGWQDMHLYEFTEYAAGGPYRYQDHEDAGADPTRSMPAQAYDLALLESRLRFYIGGGPTLSYLYDFGDRWRCRVTLRTADGEGEPYTVTHAQGQAPCENSHGYANYRRMVRAARREKEVRDYFAEVGHHPYMKVTPQSVTRQWAKWRKLTRRGRAE